MKKKDRASRDVEEYRDRARSVIKHHLGAVKRVNYLSSGRTNFVFECFVSEGEFVVRISPHAHHLNLFIKEQWATNAAKNAGIPVAEILEVGAELIDFPYMITRKTAGLDAEDHPKRLEILKELGKLGARINSIRTKGFGETFDWSDNKLSKNATFEDWLFGEFDAVGKLETLRKNGLIDTERVSELQDIFVSASAIRSRPVLNHGDLRLKNAIVDTSGKILAVIDWERCMSNISPSWELSTALHDLGIDGKQQFIEGYGIKPKQLANTIPLIRAFNIANYARSSETLGKNKKDLELYRLRLNGLLDLYSI